MIPVILSAGRGSRVGDETKDVPKWFLEIGQKHVYDYQLSALADHFDKAYVVLGHGFVHRDAPEEIIPDRDDITVESIIFDGWKEVENAGTAAFALENLPVEDDFLLVCGDIVLQPEHITEFLSTYHSDLKDHQYNAVAAFEGIQDNKTAVCWDEKGMITDYGAIEGHEEAGLFILNNAHRNEAKALWDDDPNEWFPVVFPRTESKAVTLPRDGHCEINTASDLQSVRRKLTGEPVQ